MIKYMLIVTLSILLHVSKLEIKSDIQIQEIPVTSSIVNLNPYEITFNGIEMVYNDHVGNEWYYYAKVNGRELRRGECIKVDLDEYDSITIECLLFENDPSYTDTAEKRIRLSYNEISQYENSGFAIPVTIREGHGRYAGNTAEVNFLFSARQ